MKAQKERHGNYGLKNFKEGDEVRLKLVTKHSKNIPPKTQETFFIIPGGIQGTRITAERTNQDGTIARATRDDSFFEKVIRMSPKREQPPIDVRDQQPAAKRAKRTISNSSDDGYTITINETIPDAQALVQHQLAPQRQRTPPPPAAPQQQPKRGRGRPPGQITKQPVQQNNADNQARPKRISTKPNWFRPTTNALHAIKRRWEEAASSKEPHSKEII
jgi:tRNA/tmRNA/rRNA uracil-C5-methylase (TrmA/RlmC/RlmD family)